MTEIMFGERVLVQELVPSADSFPIEISPLTMEIAREANLQTVLRIVESPEGAEAGSFVENFWSRTKK